MKSILMKASKVLGSTLVLAALVGCGNEEGTTDNSDAATLFSEAMGEGQSTPLMTPNPLDPVDPAIGASATRADNGDQGADTVSPGQASLPSDPSADPTCSRTGINASVSLATIKQGLTRFTALSGEDNPYDAVSISIYSEYNGPTTPGTYSLDGINFQDCGLCLTAYSDCGEGGCQKQFYAQEGTVEITALGTAAGETFSARLIDVKFEEVTISDDLVSTPVAGGEMWCAGDFSFEETLVEDSDSGDAAQTTIECPAGEVCVGDTVTDFSLPNCADGTNQSIQDYFADATVGWLVLTAGWCPGCAEAIPQLKEIEDQFSARGLKVGFILGEAAAQDSVPDQAYCQRYADRYDIDHGKFFLDNTDGYSYRTTFDHIFPYVDESGVFALPFTAIINPQTMEYVYADRSGEDIAEVINGLLDAEEGTATDEAAQP